MSRQHWLFQLGLIRNLNCPSSLFVTYISNLWMKSRTHLNVHFISLYLVIYIYMIYYTHSLWWLCLYNYIYNWMIKCLGYRHCEDNIQSYLIYADCQSHMTWFQSPLYALWDPCGKGSCNDIKGSICLSFTNHLQHFLINTIAITYCQTLSWITLSLMDSPSISVMD